MITSDLSTVNEQAMNLLKRMDLQLLQNLTIMMNQDIAIRIPPKGVKGHRISFMAAVPIISLNTKR